MFSVNEDQNDIVIRYSKDSSLSETMAAVLAQIHLQQEVAESVTCDDATACMRNACLVRHLPRGIALLRDPSFNKSTAFTEEEREALGLGGLLPPRVHTIGEQMKRVMGNLDKKATDMDRYIFLSALQDRNSTLFYRTLLENIEQLMPIVYTPTVGQACLEFGHIFRRPRGVYISIHDKGRVAERLSNWPMKDIRVVVVTDGERILGLGDLGADGMGIPVGKLALYTVCAGIHPTVSLPVTLDVGTDNTRLLNDPLYIGLQNPRVRGEAYDELVDEFIWAVKKLYPNALIQFEDFANRNAFRFLQKYRNEVCCFNDDIQGTASIALAGFFSALRILGGKLSDHCFLFLGAGEAGLGTGNLLVEAMLEEGLSETEARKHCWYFDSKGLVVQSRDDLNGEKRRFAHDHPFLDSFTAAVEALRPLAIVGVSGQPKQFGREVLEQMAWINEQPVIFALSNPTSKSECTAEEAYTWTGGRALFASGSPFAPVQIAGKMRYPMQGNNVYIFPGVGMGALASGAKMISDRMFLVAAKAVANAVSPEDLQQGRLYPPVPKVREVSLDVAVAVAKEAYASGLATQRQPEDVRKYIEALMYQPEYQNYV